MEIQELISRARLLFRGAPKRLEVFKSVNGKRSGKDIARKTGKGLATTLDDLLKMKHMELVQAKIDRTGKIARKQNSTVFEKVPLLRHVSMTYFQDPTKARRKFGKPISKKIKRRGLKYISIPKETEILAICRVGEDQLYEFKSSGIEMEKISREIGAFANTKMGGIIFYGIDDDGTVSGSDMHRQKFDQSLQNSIRSNISPPLTINIKERDLLGQKILLITVPAWNKNVVYHYKGKVHIRKGTNVFVATPDESRKLHRGSYIV